MLSPSKPHEQWCFRYHNGIRSNFKTEIRAKTFLFPIRLYRAAASELVN